MLILSWLSPDLLLIWSQGCILLTYLSVISSKFIQKFTQKCQCFTLIDQSVPLDHNFYITFYLRTNQLWLWKYHVIFVSILQGKLGKTKNKLKENHQNTKKTKIWDEHLRVKNLVLTHIYQQFRKKNVSYKSYPVSHPVINTDLVSTAHKTS